MVELKVVAVHQSSISRTQVKTPHAVVLTYKVRRQRDSWSELGLAIPRSRRNPGVCSPDSQANWQAPGQRETLSQKDKVDDS